MGRNKTKNRGKKFTASRAIKKEQEKLAQDVEQCQAELKPILLKYNLALRGKLQTYDDGILAFPMLSRPSEPKAESAVAAPVPPAPPAPVGKEEVTPA